MDPKHPESDLVGFQLEHWLVLINYEWRVPDDILTSKGNLAMLTEKISSIPDHLCNIHDFAFNSHHLHCSHGDLSGSNDKAWLDPNSKVLLSFIYCIK